MSNSTKRTKAVPKQTKKLAKAQQKGAPPTQEQDAETLGETRKTQINADQNDDFDDSGDDFDYCGVDLPQKARIFLVHYLTPGSPCYYNAKQAAIKAGYAESTAIAHIYRLLRSPDIQKIIKANAERERQALREAAKKILQIKMQRAMFDPSDFYETRNNKPKRLEAIPPELRVCVDGIEVRGKTKVLLLPDRTKEMNDILKLCADGTDDGGEYEDKIEIILKRGKTSEDERAARSGGMEYKIRSKTRGAQDVQP